MLNIKKLILPLLLLVFTCKGLMADHVVGSDILYKCLGNGKYEITFKFYRDCNGCNVAGGGGGGTGASCPHPVLTVTGANGSCNNQSIGTVSITRLSITDITQLCGSTKSACQNGSFPYGIEEHLYKGVIDLSAKIAQGCCKFKISTTIYVRSSTISTGAANQGFYTDATIDACNNICNNSPEYTSYPVAIICVGQDFVFNNGAIDTLDQGDSLSYALAPAYQGSSQTVSYSGSFSANRPMSFLGFPNVNLNSPAGFRLDSVTGDLSFRPTKVNETGVIVIEVTEWRRVNGTMVEIGKTRRDMQVIVVNCPNNSVPVIKPPFSANACAGQLICMDIVTTDADVNRDTVKIDWNRGIPRAVFTNNNGTVPFASGKVCWTPSEADVSTVPYTFTITAKDNACPLNGVAVRAFSIYVRESPKATRSFNKLTCGRVAVDAVPFKNYGGLVSEWRVRDSLDQNYFVGTKLKDTIQMRPGRNIATIVLKTSTPCVNAFADTIFIDPYVQVDIPSDTFLCDGASLLLDAKTRLGIPAYHYIWNTASADTTSAITVLPQSDTLFIVKVSDGQGCSSKDSIHIAHKLNPLIHLDTGSRICYNDYVQLDAGNDTFPYNYTYLWNTTDTSRKLIAKDSNFYIATVRDSIGCKSTDTFKLYVNTVPISAGPDRPICYADTLKVAVTGANTYQWYKLPSTTAFSNSPTFQEVLINPTSYKVHGIRTYGGVTCENDDTLNIAINQLPVITFNNIKDKCEKSPPFNLVEGISFPTIQNGIWSCIDDPDWVDNNNLFYPDSVIVTHPSGIQVISLNYAVVDQNGCKKSRTSTFKVIKLPIVNLKDTSLCGDKGNVDLKSLTLTPTTTAPGTWKWSSTDFTTNSAILNNGQNAVFNLSLVPQNQVYSLCLEATNPFGCINSSCLNITSRPVPVVDAGFLFSKCGNDAIFDLGSANPSPTGGSWAGGGGGIVNTNQYNPTLVLTGFHKLLYTYDIPGNNCPVTDSVMLEVKPVPGFSILPIPDICSDTGVINITSYIQPYGGVWSGSGVTPGGTFNPGTLSGVQNLRYDYTSPVGCKNFTTSTIKIFTAPTLTANPPLATCEGTPIDLKASYTNSAGMVWTTTGGGIFTPATDTVTQYSPGAADKCFDIIASTVQTGACKPVSKVIPVCFYPIPTSEILLDEPEGCEPHTVNFEAITDLPNNAKYDWNFADPSSGAANTSTNKKPSHTFQTNGTYTVNLKVTTEHNCSKDAVPLQAIIHPIPVADMDANHWITTIVQNTVNFYDRTTIDAPDKVSSYYWSFGDPDSSFSSLKNPSFEYPTDSGIYWVSLKVISEYGCENQTGRELIIKPEITVFIPNAFIPDNVGDWRNERFWVTADGFSGFNISIFSRWGEMVYTSTDIKEGWDGRYKGFPVQQDVYFYVVTITGLDGVKYDYKGTITLLR